MTSGRCRQSTCATFARGAATSAGRLMSRSHVKPAARFLRDACTARYPSCGRLGQHGGTAGTSLPNKPFNRSSRDVPSAGSISRPPPPAILASAFRQDRTRRRCGPACVCPVMRPCSPRTRTDWRVKSGCGQSTEPDAIFDISFYAPGGQERFPRSGIVVGTGRHPPPPRVAGPAEAQLAARPVAPRFAGAKVNIVTERGF